MPHLGDKDEFLPTAHGFDEFYGNLYHLNAEEEPELPDYPKESDFPGFRKKFGPRGVIHSFADGKIEDTGPLTKKRMETIDDDVAARAADFIERQHKADKPLFVWVNFTHMHLRTHTKPESLGQVGRWQSPYHDTMIDHDKNVGTVLQKIDELGLADNTIVFYSTDNGPHMNTWPDGAMTPFRSEKDTNWEGAYRVPAMVRWPGHIKPGSVSNDIVSHLDWAPTLLAAAGVPDVKDKLLKGYKAGNKTFKVHLDGYNQLPYLTGQEPKSPRQEFFYFSDDGDLTGLRYDNWKLVFAQQRSPGTLALWGELQGRDFRLDILTGHPGPVGRTLRQDPDSLAVQPPHRSLREGDRHFQHLLGLVYRPCLPAGAGSAVRRPVPANLQGLPAPPEGRQLHHRPGHGAVAGAGEPLSKPRAG